MKQELSLKPAILTIFGITGDLAARKLLPAIYHLYHEDLLPDKFRLVGVSRRNISAEQVIESIQNAVIGSGEKCDTKTIDKIKQSVSTVKVDLTSGVDYQNLKQELDQLEDNLGVCLERLFYLAIPSNVFGPIVELLGKQALNTGCQHGKTESHLLIEKPFGYDLTSAQELVKTVNDSFKEEQVYRIDHYLAKETVQNILTFRFENPLFSEVWDNKHISHITITAAEQIGIEGRISFYESTGAMRDVLQSHLMQLLALVTMDNPYSKDAAKIHAAKKKVLASVKPPSEQDMAKDSFRSQYEGYTDEVESQNSSTETFAAVKLSIDNDIWRGVPILLRTGKNLCKKITEITIVFRNDEHPDKANYLTLKIQPDEGIVLTIRLKKPGYDDVIQKTTMEFSYNSDESVQPDAYARVIVDALRADRTLFTTSDEVLESWRALQPVLNAWQNNLVPMSTYPKGSWGPEGSEKLVG